MLTLATKITLLRIVLIPLVLLLLYFENPTNCILAAIAFGVAGITDWMDGYVARHHGMVTNMGKFLDPLADKLLVADAVADAPEVDETVKQAQVQQQRHGQCHTRQRFFHAAVGQPHEAGQQQGQLVNDKLCLMWP